MKKTIAKLLCVIMAAVMGLTVLVGCEWITTNTDRDMEQVVATVKISDNIDSENIYKRQLVSGYVSYGYQYVSYYGQTVQQAYQSVLDNLVNNRLVIQQSRLALAELYNGLLSKTADLTEFEDYFKTSATAGGTAIDPKSGENDNLKLYLSEYEIAQAYYAVRSNVNNMIKAYVTDETEAPSKEDVTYTARTTPDEEEDTETSEWQLKDKTPTEDQYKVAALTLVEDYNDLEKAERDAALEGLKNTYQSVYDLNMAVWTAYKISIASAEERKAYGSLLQFLREQGLIGSDETFDYAEDVDNVLKYSYFKDNLKSQLESLIVSKYEQSLITDVQSKLTDAAVWEQYKVDYENQKALYMNDYSAYETALSSASDTSFVLYNPFEGYGYVANLLIGFTTEQTTALNEFKSKAGVTNNEIEEFRASLANKLFAKDQRDTWVYLGYGKYSEGEFAFDDKYMLSDLDAVKNYIGTFTVDDEEGYEELNDSGVKETKWSFKNVTADALAFNDFVNDYLSLAGISDHRYENGQDFGVIAGFDKDALNRIRDLIFAFNTDAGGLRYEYGYVYSPMTSSTQYVREFAAASKLVVENGVGAYTMVITDYGIHVIVCTKLVTEPYDVENGEAAFTADLADKTTLAYTYTQVKLDAVTNTEIGKVVNRFMSKYRKENVTYFENTYKDLFEPTSAQ
ncbi:MAG: hypothetical protein ILP02_04450 [Clostridia bacterium]|nr:hypothetical protein [Clostridia bacterium]